MTDAPDVIATRRKRTPARLPRVPCGETMRARAGAASQRPTTPHAQAIAEDQFQGRYARLHVLGRKPARYMDADTQELIAGRG
ncbi:hypothetical protein [Streptomyces sp. NPDC097610]|uniref:hypothetical protein n=1 Tax=Streptomyces sp. NPDC097610 TaxID=3157227 RepID=UPI003333D1B5